MKIGIAADHGAFEFKEKLVEHLKSTDHDVKDYGTHSAESTNYAVYGKKVANGVVAKEVDLGIALCTSGIGISISVNRVKGARGALCRNVHDAYMSRFHNDANVLCMGSKETSLEDAKKMIKEFTTTEFEGGRHVARVASLDE